MATNKNEGRRVMIVGNENGYSVTSVEPDGAEYALPARAVTVTFHDSGTAEAVCYFTNPILNISAPRASDGVREDPPEEHEL